MNAPPVVIVGTGRSGSGYLARVLTAAGAPCGHEQWWNPFGDRHDGLVADSSWCALAFDLTGTRVLHQVRHPLDVVSSLVHAPIPRGPYLEMLEQLVAVPMDALDLPQWALAVWLELTQRATDLADWGWRVEDLDARLVRSIAGECGIDVDPGRARQALEDVPRDHNRHSSEPRLSWDELPDCELKTLVFAGARHWGYA